jgi:cytochrome c oxidase subunit 2
MVDFSANLLLVNLALFAVGAVAIWRAGTKLERYVDRIAALTGRATTVLILAIACLGCRGNPIQSAMHPAGTDASEIVWLTWLMTITFSCIFVLVMALLLWAIVRKQLPRERMPPLGRSGFVIAGGIALPLVTVLPLYVLSLETSADLHPGDNDLVIRVIGHQWWWDVHYPDSGITTANEIYIPVDQVVKLELLSADVIHSFWVPSLNGKRDLVPGLKNEFWLRANSPGVYRGQCAEYCGTQHANMSLHVIAVPDDEFRSWVQARREPREFTASESAQRGRDVFMRAGCARCHTIRDTAAQGKVGPDLTHVASRRFLGAGLLRNTKGNLMGWVSNAPSIKPGVRMPKTYLSRDELFALVDYLEMLE